MNDIDKMPVKCRDCPYWEIATYPWCCGDCKDIMNPKNGEYIKRIDAKRALTALSADLDAETVQRCIEAMNNLKAADVEPVRHGRWVNDSDNIPHCSECEAIALQRHKLYLSERIFEVPFVLSKRCPECGAKMDAEPPKENDDAKVC